MKSWEIDINCDVGEGINNEAQLFPFISSCNLACGGHAGDTETMNRVIALARKHHVKIGAHPSYPDRANFGRVSMTLPGSALKKSINDQISQLVTQLRAQGSKLHHIKAHGALYNDLRVNKDLAMTFLESIEKYKTTVSVYTSFGSALATEAHKQGFKVVYEAFGDRNYNQDLSLVSRKDPDALILEPTKVADHLLMIIKKGLVCTVDRKFVPIKADTFCIHGDTPSAYQILMYLSQELPKHHIHLKK